MSRRCNSGCHWHLARSDACCWSQFTAGCVWVSRRTMAPNSRGQRVPCRHCQEHFRINSCPDRGYLNTSRSWQCHSAGVSCAVPAIAVECVANETSTRAVVATNGIDTRDLTTAIQHVTLIPICSAVLSKPASVTGTQTRRNTASVYTLQRASALVHGSQNHLNKSLPIWLLACVNHCNASKCAPTRTTVHELCVNTTNGLVQSVHIPPHGPVQYIFKQSETKRRGHRPPNGRIENQLTARDVHRSNGEIAVIRPVHGLTEIV